MESYSHFTDEEIEAKRCKSLSKTMAVNGRVGIQSQADSRAYVQCTRMGDQLTCQQQGGTEEP